ncbi:MAG: hypothetical protein KatS3mg111_4154 [Pirellulaceae bacterium]|nr:MAG: hypothetical protein KatS3mg111_4154 [Pirellulaceae bacterium]
MMGRETGSLTKWLCALAGGGLVLAAVVVGFLLGNRAPSPPVLELPPAWAATAASSDNMAVATGPVSEDAEGVFFLDFLTGELQCLLYYPRVGAFGGRYFTNVLPHLGNAGKNSKYLLVTGNMNVPAVSGRPRPGGCLVYVTNLNTGMFAAYAVPWDRTAEAANQVQSGPLVYVGGGPIRNFQIQANNNNQPAAIVDPNQKPNPAAPNKN